jgi:hypothetical protein
VLGGIVLGGIVLGGIVLGGIVLGGIVLGGIVLGGIVLGGIVLGGIVLGGIVLGGIVLGGIDFASFYDFSIAFWNCSESVVIYLNFITLLQINYCNRIYLSFNCCLYELNKGNRQKRYSATNYYF